MKVTNLTDVETKALKQRKLHNQNIAVGDKMLAPGTSADVDDATLARIRPSLQDMVSKGMLAVGEDLPADYKVAKERATAAAAAPKPALVTLAEPAGVPASEAVTEPAPAEASDDAPMGRRRGR